MLSSPCDAFSASSVRWSYFDSRGCGCAASRPGDTMNWAVFRPLGSSIRKISTQSATYSRLSPSASHATSSVTSSSTTSPASSHPSRAALFRSLGGCTCPPGQLIRSTRYPRSAQSPARPSITTPGTRGI